MAYEFKKLSEMELLDSVPKNAAVLAEVDGVIRRVPGDGLGSGGGVTVTDLLPETVYSDFEFSDDFGIYGTKYQANGALIEGETYSICWDATVYKCVAQYYGEGMVALGNAADWGLSGNGEPFVALDVAAGAGLIGSLTDTEAGGTHTVRIYQEVAAPGMAYDHVIFNSSTAGSSKQFKLTVDDSGAVTATEII